jgi:CDP-2,3-bis-(O-geranylgeranyl)-sn-glycerol synthase
LFLTLKLLALLLAANGAPILVRQLLPGTGGCPLDAGKTAWDGRPLLGHSKTARGLLAALVLTAVLALLLGMPLLLGVTIGFGAMAGDLLSSFIKRRLGIEPSSPAPGLDQIPESLLPLILVAEPLGLAAMNIAIIVLLFITLELTLSRILFRMHIRKRPC